jgi:3-phenylpropionate/cinnamic acid dioxygenase small subunit
LLDEQRMEEWGALFTEDGEYWVPAAPDQPDPKRHVSLIYDPPLLRAVRIKRFKHPNAFSMQPRPRTVHLVSNVMLDAFDAASGSCTVNSRLVMIEFHRERQNVYGGSCTHELQATGEGWRIRMKKVVLANCEGMLESILIPL